MFVLGQGEKILYIARKHWFIFIMQVAFVVFLALLPLALFLLPVPIPPDLFRFGWSIWLLLSWLVATLIWTDYYLDVWMLTPSQIVAIEQRGLFNRSVSSFRPRMVQDVIVEVPGILATLIDFGTVKVQTASEETFTIRGVARPYRLKEQIMLYSPRESAPMATRI